VAATNINRVVLTGNLTKDPELRSLPSGTSVCEIRLGCNTRGKVNDEWVDQPNYFNVKVYGAHGENCARWLNKGRPVAIDGKLKWREWETPEGKRQAVEIIADNVQFLGSRDGTEGDGADYVPEYSPVPAGASAAGQPDESEDIPF
jgi:single-strand DNA-binding protein